METLAPRLSCTECGKPIAQGHICHACVIDADIDESKLNEQRAALLKMEQDAGQPIHWMRKILF